MLNIFTYIVSLFFLSFFLFLFLLFCIFVIKIQNNKELRLDKIWFTSFFIFLINEIFILQNQFNNFNKVGLFLSANVAPEALEESVALVDIKKSVHEYTIDSFNNNYDYFIEFRKNYIEKKMKNNIFNIKDDSLQPEASVPLEEEGYFEIEEINPEKTDIIIESKEKLLPIEETPSNSQWWCETLASSDQLREDGRLKRKEYFNKIFEDGKYNPDKINQNSEEWIDSIWNEFFDHDDFWFYCLSGALPSDCVNQRNKLLTEVNFTNCDLVKKMLENDADTKKDDILVKEIQKSFKKKYEANLQKFYDNPEEVIDNLVKKNDFPKPSAPKINDLEDNEKIPPKLYSFLEDLDVISSNNLGLLFDNNIYLGQMVSIFFFLIFLILSIFSYKNVFINFEFYLLSFLYLFSILILFMADSFLNFYVSLELFGLISYVFVSYFKTSFLSIEASIKYFFFSSFASIILLLGITLIYLSAGVSSFTELNYQVSLQGEGYLSEYVIESKIFFCGLFFIVTGFFIKLGVAPFHFWLIDVYESLSFPLLFLFSVLPKIVYFFLLSNFYFPFLNLSLENVFPNEYYLSIFYQFFLLISILVGTFGGLFQTKVTRLFAYSSVLNNGFFLLIFLSLNVNLFYSLFLFYYLNYCFLTFIIFGVFILFNYFSANKLILNNLTDLSKISVHFLFSLLVIFSLFSLASVPPFAGFFVKFFLIFFVFDSVSLFSVFVILLCSFLSSIYYLRIVKIILFEPSSYTKSFYVGSSTTQSNTLFFCPKESIFLSFCLNVYIFLMFILSFVNLFFICFLDTFFLIFFF